MASLGITATVQRVGGGLPIKIKFAVSAERNGRRCQLASARSYAIGAISSSASTPPSEAQRWNVPIASIKLGWNSWGLPCGLGGYVAPRAIFVSNNGARFIILPYKHTKRKTNHLRLLGSSGAPPVRSPTPPPGRKWITPPSTPNQPLGEDIPFLHVVFRLGKNALHKKSVKLAKQLRRLVNL